jgi:dipeptidyl aminopeptidase/acylaminoacyl peptidase
MPARRRVLCALLVLLSIASVAAAQKRAMTIDDVIDLAQVSSPRISPDGRRVIYTLSELGKWKDNKRVTRSGSPAPPTNRTHRFLQQRSRATGRRMAASSPSPTRGADGSAKNDTPEAGQIWVIPVDGGRRRS